MSKAEQWAKAHRARPLWKATAPCHGNAAVNDEGNLEIASMGHMIVINRTVAVDLARWIIDTFGDDAR